MAAMDFAFQKHRAPLFWLCAAAALLALIGFLDYLTGPEVASSLFYLLPVSVVSWYVGRRAGIVFSVLGAAIWLTADVAAGSMYSSGLIYSWNALVRLGFFLVVALLLAALRRQLEHEKEMARTDELTGSLNSRSFYELLSMEIERSRRNRQPFTAAYIDLDRFKEVNDRLGHLSGDQVLRSVVGCIRGLLRRTDVVARLGGDEFVVLLPETGEHGARDAMGRIHSTLKDDMRDRGWPVTFSIGVVTFASPPPSADEVVRLADDLMYAVKREGRDAIKHQVYSY
jgi:diguanylate cyclase (GGDEF)-like protein